MSTVETHADDGPQRRFRRDIVNKGIVGFGIGGK